MDAVRLIAARVTDPHRVDSAVQAAHQQTHFPGSIHWEPFSVAQGDAGQALLATQLARAFPDAGWERVAAEHFARAAYAFRRTPALPVSAVSGTSGLAFTARRLGPDDPARRLLPDVDARVAEAGLGLAARLHRQHGTSVSTFDLISGLSGVVVSMLPTSSSSSTPPALSFLVRALCRLALADDDQLPAWHTPVGQLHDERQTQLYPDGNLNCGLAHGIPGPLAALSLTVLSGYESEDIRLAVRRLADWLIEHRSADATGNPLCGAPTWPSVIALRHDDHGHLVSAEPRETGRDAWCYGTPGVARALHLAGRALADESLCDEAVAAMSGVYARPPESRGIDSPTFCHGVAGLLQITLRFAYDTGLEMFDQAAQDLTDQILAQVNPERPVAIATIEPEGNLVDQPGLLDGASGVCLVLLGAATDREPTWDRIFGLA